MKFYKKFVITSLILSLLAPNLALGFIATENEAEAIEFVKDLGFDFTYEEATENITFGELIKVLISSNGSLPEIVSDEYGFSDVPAEFEAYAEKARQLGLVYYNRENPIFGYNTEVSIGKALDTAFRYYGVANPRYLLDEAKFKQDVTNFNSKFIDAPLIERAIFLGIMKPQDGKVSYFEKITKRDVANIIYRLQDFQLKLLNNSNTAVQKLSPAVKNVENSNSILVQNEKFKILEDVYKRLNTQFYGKNSINTDNLFYGAISGLVDKLGDAYSTFQEPETQQSFKNSLSNQVEGIGASLGLDEQKRVVVISPLADSPAQKAGLKAKDLILKVDDVTVQNMTLSQVVAKIQGTAGTKVKLSISRNGVTLDLNITRASISVPSVTAEITSNNIGVIKVRNFGLGIEDSFEDYVNQFKTAKIKGVIIDLRDNPGGYLESATSLAANFMQSGKLVSKVQYVENKYQDNKTKTNGKLAGIPVVVLINGGTASAAEILAAALHDNIGAKLVGEKSFGKGTVQELITYSDNSALKLTIAHWLTPKGTDINKVGISPDVFVELSESDRKIGNDPQMNRALLLLR